MPSERLVSKAELTHSFTIIMAGSEAAAIFCAVFIESPRRSVSGTTRATSPARSASAASAAQRVACDGGDDGFSRMRHPFPVLGDEVLLIDFGEILPGHLGDVGPR